jgi:hypothetical protein
MQKYLFAIARVIVQHFLMTAPMIKDILQRELGMRKFSEVISISMTVSNYV